LPKSGSISIAEALGRSLGKSTLKAHGPAQKGVRLGRGVNRDGPLVVLDRSVEVPFHLVAVGRPPEFRRPSQIVWLFHRFSLSTGIPPAQMDFGRMRWTKVH
jgi:hypothetical protein